MTVFINIFFEYMKTFHALFCDKKILFVNTLFALIQFNRQSNSNHSKPHGVLILYKESFSGRASHSRMP